MRITARVEEDKTLRWWFRIGDGDAQPAPSVDDPWTSRALSVSERALMEARRAIRDALTGGRPVTGRMLVDEANAIRVTGDFDTALLAIEDCIDENERDPHAHNIRGLILGTLGVAPNAFHAYSRAMQLMPDNAVYIANAGITFQQDGGVGYNASIGSLRMALDKDPSLAYAYIGLGDAYRATGDEPRAQVEYRRALELLRKEVEARPFQRDSWSRLCTVHHALGDYRRADDARAVLKRIDRDALYEGDSAHVIAGPARKPVTAGAE